MISARLLVATTVTVVFASMAVPSAAEAPEATGWWSRTRIGPVAPVDTPSTVPPGGLYVAGEPTGPVGVSALRLTVGDGVVTDVVLEVDSTQGTPAVVACITPVVWTPEEGGPLSSAPPEDCESGSAEGTADEGIVRIPAGALVREGMLNVVLLPSSGAVFQTAFKAPGPETVTVSYPDANSSSEFPTFEPGPAFESGPDTTFDPGPGAFFGDAGFSPPPPVAAPAEPGQVASGPSVPFVDASRRPAPPVARDPGNRPQFIAALILLDLGLLYLWLLRRQGRQARLIGADGGQAADGAPVRGIGRFARERTGAAPRL